MAWRYGALALCAVLTAAAAPKAKVADLGWMAGTWVSETPKGWTEEHWMPPRGGVMLGTNRSGQGNAAKGFEFMRIAEGADGTVIFWASPSGAPASAFPLTSLKPNEAVFENPAHDYPTKIVYRRDGNRLVGTISGAGGKNPMSWTFRRR